MDFAMRIVNSIVRWLLAIRLAGFATLGQGGKALNAPITVGDLAAFVVAFVLIVGIAKLTDHLAARKGFSYTAWSYYGLFLGIIALPHAALKKHRQAGR